MAKEERRISLPWRRHSNCSSFTGGEGEKKPERLQKALAVLSFPAVLTNFCETDGWQAETLRTAKPLNQLTLPSAMKSIIKLTLPSLPQEHLGFVMSFPLSLQQFKGNSFQ